MDDIKQFEDLDTGLLIRAPAKINLTLLIAGKRPDGFHEIETVMQKVTYYDEILIESGRQSGIELVCQGPHWAPAGPENLVLRAAHMLLKHVQRKDRLKITLTKNIPAGSGLGSASSDAAATLLGVNRYLNLDIPPAILTDMAARLGSDVPFFLGGSLAYCTGRGEIIQPLKKNIDFQILLIIPNITISTAKIYENYQHDPIRYEQLHKQITKHIYKNRIDLLIKMCTNMLDDCCFQQYESLKRLKGEIEALGKVHICLSGSGSTIFYCFDRNDSLEAHRLQVRLSGQSHFNCFIVTNNHW
jgi:4-diphosphocytidyl-2-C-methyl-D-erythritol kinase